MSLPLDGRVVLVTGVSRRIGIGFALAQHLGRLGADLVVQSWTAHDAEQEWGADPAGIEAVGAELRASVPGRRVEHVEADFADPLAPAAVIDGARRAFGAVDALVCNHARSSHQDLEHLTASELDLCLAVN